MKRKWLQMLKSPPKLTISEWADKYRKLPSSSAEPGQWRTSRVPYFFEVMDALNAPSVNRIAVKSAAQVGKALWVETPIKTADGFKAMGAVEVGDKVFDENGELCNVTAVSPIMFGRDCYEIIFSDGARLIADAEHNWIADGRKVKTVELKIGMKLPTARAVKSIRRVASVPVKCISVDSPSHLYLAGEELIPTHNSEILLNIVGYYAHMSPCNVMIMQATLETAEDFSKSRLAKMIQDTPILTPLFYDKEKTRDPNQTILSKFFKGGRVILTGANSPAGLASRPIKILLCDETDRYPISASKEGDPISLAEKRTTTYFDKKIALFSTPTLEGTSRIDVEYNLGTQEEWSHECPNCGEYHALRYENMIRGAVVKWRCPDCGHDFTRAQMTESAQKYVIKNPGAIKNGIRSFWISGFSSPWLKWEEILREWDEAQGLPEREAVVMNTRFGLSYRFERREIDESALADNLIDYDGEIPRGVLCLTCGVDVQTNRLHYAIYGFNSAQIYGISYGIIYGKPTADGVWQGLDAILNKEYEFSDGRRLKIARTFIDSGFATDSVYKYCRRANAYAIKGLGTPGTPLLHKISTQGGVNLIILGVNEGKQSVLNRLEKIKYGRDDGFMIRNFDERFFKEMTAERKVLKKTGAGFVEVYENIFRQRNEALDCSVYAYAAMRSLITGDEKNFWLNQEENLRGESVKKAKKITRHKMLDIWG